MLSHWKMEPFACYVEINKTNMMYINYSPILNMSVNNLKAMPLVLLQFKRQEQLRNFVVNFIRSKAP